jgi:hypothetical protein
LNEQNISHSYLLDQDGAFWRHSSFCVSFLWASVRDKSAMKSDKGGTIQ